MIRILVLLAALVLTGCGSGGSGGDSNISNSPASYKIQTGYAQKGPLQAGSTITVMPLNNDLESTGNIYITTTYDDLGHFNLSQTLPGRFVEIIGEGYYLDETTGRFTGSKVSLRGIVDLSVESSPSINVLTALQVNRLRNLIRSGLDYESAYKQSQEEVLNVFGISGTAIRDLTNLYCLKIEGSGDGDAVLLAISTVLIKAAQARNGASTEAELSDIMSSISTQLGQNGSVTQPSLASELIQAAANVDKAAVRSNLERFFLSRGVTVTIPVFEDWVYSVGTGSTLPVRTKVSPDDFSFADYLEAIPSTRYSSDLITVSGLEPGVNAVVSLEGQGEILKNGTSVATNTYATNGDHIQLSALSASDFKGSKTLTLTIGTKSASWTIQNQDPELAVPADFSFTPSTASGPYAPASSNEIVISGLDAAASARVTVHNATTPVWMDINNVRISMFTNSSYVTVKNGDKLRVSTDAGPNGTTMIIQIGVKQATWVVTLKQ